jgi:hypothetical protein
MALSFQKHQKIWLTVGGAIATWEIISADDKLTWSDAPAIGTFVGGTAFLWATDFLEWKNFSKKPLYILEAAIVTGGIASYAIGGKEGLFTYKDFITDPIDIVRDPEKTSALMSANRVVQGIITLGGSELVRFGVETISDFKDDIFKNRFSTGPALPF